MQRQIIREVYKEDKRNYIDAKEFATKIVYEKIREVD
ncbi:hypothetical protein KN1_09860 [Stygiolobus caldivivus]|uniref:Uncharacterized protein n=1 Tax=Stygiolobus caldivivus TaxID=2824673 RepID=A0A8D5ZHH0_9CREN|nr:hypothetical protein KN1_09860 [Stygiolobus caldivivus]